MTDKDDEYIIPKVAVALATCTFVKDMNITIFPSVYLLYNDKN